MERRNESGQDVEDLGMQGPGMESRDAHPGDDLLVTGGSGFLGSHLVLEWLRRHPDARIACLTRGPDDATVSLRLHTALLRAASDSGQPTGLEPLSRVTAVRGELGDDGRWVDAAAAWAERCRRPVRVLHCAASLSFRAEDRAAVRRINIDGTYALLSAAARLGAAEFNHVSTAYVAGNRGGTILEDPVCRPAAFSNGYEESKWDAEAAVRAFCAARGIGYRILRPSIIIGHSATHRLSSSSGFYNVVQTIFQLGRVQRHRGELILLPLPSDATLDLIPVDVVAGELVELLRAGGATLNHAFHLTSDGPLSLIEVLARLSPLAGFSIDRMEGSEPVSRLGGMLMGRLRHYTPYLGQVRRFDRGNVRAAGVVVQPALDVARLRDFVVGYMERERPIRSPECAGSVRVLGGQAL